MRARSLGVLALAVLLITGCAGPAAPPSNQPDPTNAGLISAVPTPVESPSPVATTPTAEPTSVETIDPTSAPTSAPTAKPTQAPVVGVKSCTATVRDPVVIGEKAKVTVKCPVGPTCALVMHYPTWEVVDLPNPTHPNPGWWQWTWTVPARATAGEARGTAECIEDGVRHAMGATFTIKKAPWSIDVSVASPFDHTTLPEIGSL